MTENNIIYDETYLHDVYHKFWGGPEFYDTARSRIISEFFDLRRSANYMEIYNNRPYAYQIPYNRWLSLEEIATKTIFNRDYLKLVLQKMIEEDILVYNKRYNKWRLKNS